MFINGILIPKEKKKGIQNSHQTRQRSEEKKILHALMTNTCPNFTDQYSIRNYIYIKELLTK